MVAEKPKTRKISQLRLPVMVPVRICVLDTRSNKLTKFEGDRRWWMWADFSKRAKRSGLDGLLY